MNDVNEYAPKFNQPSYVVDVDEGRPADKIHQVEANDADCSAKYGDICRYDILNKDQPFAIDNEGACVLYSTYIDYSRNLKGIQRCCCCCFTYMYHQRELDKSITPPTLRASDNSAAAAAE